MTDRVHHHFRDIRSYLKAPLMLNSFTATCAAVGRPVAHRSG